jgi:hypothetical protein
LKTENLQAEVTAIDQESAQLEIGVERDIVKKLLNLIERLIAENAEQKAELQKLRDGIKQLKGEQGKPDIKANKKKDGDISSEDERRQAAANANGEEAKDIDGKKKRLSPRIKRPWPTFAAGIGAITLTCSNTNVSRPLRKKWRWKISLMGCLPPSPIMKT